MQSIKFEMYFVNKTCNSLKSVSSKMYLYFDCYNIWEKILDWGMPLLRCNNIGLRSRARLEVFFPHSFLPVPVSMVEHYCICIFILIIINYHGHWSFTNNNNKNTKMIVKAKNVHLILNNFVHIHKKCIKMIVKAKKYIFNFK